MKAAATLLTGAIVAVLAAGCGSGGATKTVTVQAPPTPAATTTAAPSGNSSAGSSQHGYLSIANNGEIFVQWTRSGDTLTGTLTEAYVNASNPTQLQNENDPFTGTVSGSSVTIDFGGTSWNGTLDGSALTFSVPQSDGSLLPTVFKPASINDYNSAVASTQAQVGAAQTTQQQQQQQQANQRATDDAASTVSYDIQNLSDDLSNLAGDLENVKGDISNIAGDVTSVKGDLQTVHSDTPDVMCNDAGVASNDAGVADNDYGVQQNDASVFNSDAQSIPTHIASLRSDNAQLRHDIAVIGYTPASAPTQAAVDAAISSTQAQLAKDRTTLAGYLASGKQTAAQAHAVADQAQAYCNQHGQ